MRGLLRYYRALRNVGVSRLRSAHAARRTKHGRILDEREWPEP